MRDLSNNLDVLLIFFHKKKETTNYILLKYLLLLCQLFIHLILLEMAYVITEDCIACGTCISECPVGAISEGDIYVIDPDVCTDCGSCADVCPSEAIHPA